MDIKASDVKSLREKTGAGMLDCKKALTEAEGNMAAAEKLLREWGMAGVEKRSGRSTNEGKIFIAESAGAITLVEIACETDFVTRNADFNAAGKRIVDIAHAKGYDSPNAELEGMVRDIASVIKENIALKRVRRIVAGIGEHVHSYTHGDGNLCVVVRMKSDKPEAFANPAVAAFVHDTALHIAAFNPTFLDESKPDPAWIREQEEIFAKQVELDEKMHGKPQNVIQGILRGKLKKLLTELCLMDQGFVKDEKIPVSAALAVVAKQAGCTLGIVDFTYMKVGEARS